MSKAYHVSSRVVPQRHQAPSPPHLSLPPTQSHLLAELQQTLLSPCIKKSLEQPCYQNHKCRAIVKPHHRADAGVTAPRRPLIGRVPDHLGASPSSITNQRSVTFNFCDLTSRIRGKMCLGWAANIESMVVIRGVMRWQEKWYILARLALGGSLCWLIFHYSCYSFGRHLPQEIIFSYIKTSCWFSTRRHVHSDREERPWRRRLNRSWCWIWH